jgi:phosphate transport system substrate-binding protein
MTQPKNDVIPLLAAFLITSALVGGAVWWLFQRTRSSPIANPDSSLPTASTGSRFSDVAPVPSGMFNYGGSTVWAPIRLAVDSAIQLARPEFRLRYVSPATGQDPGTTTGIQMLLRNELAFAQTSRSLTNSETQQAEQQGFKLKQVPVAIDGLAVVVHPNLNLPGLTIAQLEAIYLGKVANWQQVGGPNLPIQPFTRSLAAGGTVGLFAEQVLKGQPFGATVKTVRTTTEGVAQVAATPGGIYYASAPEVVPQCRVKPVAIGQTADQFVPPYQEPLVPPSDCPAQRNRLNAAAFQARQYPLTRNLFVVIKQNGQTDEQAGEAYANLLLTDEGQNGLAAAGYVKIR